MNRYFWGISKADLGPPQCACQCLGPLKSSDYRAFAHTRVPVSSRLSHRVHPLGVQQGRESGWPFVTQTRPTGYLWSTFHLQSHRGALTMVIYWGKTVHRTQPCLWAKHTELMEPGWKRHGQLATGPWEEGMSHVKLTPSSP